MYTKTITADIKAVGDEDQPADGASLGAGQFTAYASVFGNVDSYGEIVEKGAFATTLEDWKAKDAPIPVYWAHLMGASPLMNLGHVLDATEDDHGLLVTAQLDTKRNPEAAYVYELMKDKRVDQMSFAYDVLGKKDEGDNVVLTELKLHEVSVVPVGANQDTEIIDVKAARAAADRIGGRGTRIGQIYDAGPVLAQMKREAVRDPLANLMNSISYATGGVIPAKAGRVLSAKNETAIRDAIKGLTAVLDSLGSEDDGKATVPTVPAASAALHTLLATYRKRVL